MLEREKKMPVFHWRRLEFSLDRIAVPPEPAKEAGLPRGVCRRA